MKLAYVSVSKYAAKTNPLADIGVDFDAINRKEKRMEKPSQTPAVSNISMGKAMGSGTGIGRAGAAAIRGAPNPVMGSSYQMGMGGAPGMGMGGVRGPGMGMVGGPGMGMGMGGGPGAGMGMGMGGGYGGYNQPVGGMMMGNMGIGQGVQMQQPPAGFPPRGYNPMMGTGNYGQQPYNGGYR